MEGMSIPRPPNPGQSLAERFPTVAAQWHPTRNGDRTPDQVLAGTEGKAWWQCDLGHEWETAVNDRTSGSSGCPVHSGRKLLAGYNDLATRSPDIAAQWHPTRNGDRTPAQVLAGTNAKAWWRCDEGHEWEAEVRNRTTKGSGCPVCSRRRALAGVATTSLATTSPDVAKQWHPTRNGDLRPDQVSMGSEKRVWWRCEQGHEWEATVYIRIYGGFGCPVCSGR